MNSNINQNAPDYLYHYTSFTALDGILSSGEIWLSNIHKMNDSSEMEYFWERLKESVIKDCPEKADRITADFIEQKNRLSPEIPYSFSLSMLEDDAAQWERYADNAKGIQLKFSKDKLDKTIDHSKMFLQPVFYGQNADNHQLKGYLTLYYATGILTGFSLLNGMYENAWACSVAFKHKSFKAEAEYRIVTLPFACEEVKSKIIIQPSSYGIKEFYPIIIYDSLNRDSFPIEEIMIGPRATISPEILKEHICKKYPDFSEIKITKSECPLR